MSAAKRHPSLTEYYEALEEPGDVFELDELRSAEFAPNPSLPYASFIWASGNFAVVAKAMIGGTVWAVRLLLRHQEHLADRYQAIDALPPAARQYFVKTRFVPDAIRIGELEGVFPVVLMEWIDGERLLDVVLRACRARDLQTLTALQLALDRMRLDLHSVGIAHGDITTSNVLVERAGPEVRLRFVDYDSLWIPGHCELECSVGLGGLQHPRRPNPIGASADTAAFGMLTVGLDVLLKFPELASEESLDGDGFLVTVAELRKGRIPVAKRFLELRRGQLLRDYFDGPIDAHCRVWDEVTEEVGDPQESSPDSHRDQTGRSGSEWTVVDFLKSRGLDWADLHRAHSGFANIKPNEGLTDELRRRLESLLASGPEISGPVAPRRDQTGGGPKPPDLTEQRTKTPVSLPPREGESLPAIPPGLQRKSSCGRCGAPVSGFLNCYVVHIGCVLRGADLSVKVARQATELPTGSALTRCDICDQEGSPNTLRQTILHPKCLIEAYRAWFGAHGR